jgi:hypothetical protein
MALLIMANHGRVNPARLWCEYPWGIPLLLHALPPIQTLP